jgi:aminomethyltransferase
MRRTPLYDSHESAGARFTEFGGFEMPVQFDSIREEHAAVRESAGQFDVSHMGEVLVSGSDAGALVDRLTSREASALDPGRATYAMLTDADGVILDDVVVYRPPETPPAGAPAAADFLVVPNAGHDDWVAERFRDYREDWELDASVENATEDCALLAVQGPDAVEMVAQASPGGDAITALSRFGATWATVGGADCLVSRTGYTGEDGLELLCASADATAVWSALDGTPCGLGARDTLRIEMGFLLSGQDFGPEENPRNPYEAGVEFAVDLDHEFVGRDALARVAEAGVEEAFVGLVLEERAVPRHGHAVQVDGETIGEVTSGTMSPTLDEPVGLGYLPVEYADPDTPVEVVVRGDPKRARVVAPPFLPGY